MRMKRKLRNGCCYVVELWESESIMVPTWAKFRPKLATFGHDGKHTKRKANERAAVFCGLLRSALANLGLFRAFLEKSDLWAC